MLITAIILGLSMFENHLIVDEQVNQILSIIENNYEVMTDTSDTNSNNTIYATQYFIAKIENNTIVNIDVSKTSISEAEAMQIATKSLSLHEDSGYVDNFKFKKQSNDKTKYIFLDCKLQLANLKLSSEASFIIYMISMLVVFCILTMISGRVLKPITENIRKQKQFVTNAGHELKTPLAIMTANIDVLEDDVGEDNEWLLSLRNQVDRLDRLIKSLLSLSQYEDTSIQTEKEITIFNLNELIKEEIENFKPMALDKNITLSCNETILLKTEVETIRQLIGLFLDNAIKYTPENKDITITLKSSKNKIKMIFENDFDSSKKLNTKRIFERFYRGDKSHDKSVQGYGIGLSIVLSIVEKYNGKISVSKNESKIRFTVIFANSKKKNFEIIQK